MGEEAGSTGGRTVRLVGGRLGHARPTPIRSSIQGPWPEEYRAVTATGTPRGPPGAGQASSPVAHAEPPGPMTGLPLVVAITGASGAPYAVRVLAALAHHRVPTWLIV